MPHIKTVRPYAVLSLTLVVTVVGLMNWQPASSHSTASSCTTPVFSAPTNYAVGPQPYSIAIGDFDGDGASDLVTANSQTNNPSFDPRSVSVLLGNGTGSFSVAHFPIAPLGNPWPSSVATGDFNNDGLSDIVTANRNAHNISLLLSAGAGAFQQSLQFNVGVNPVSVAVGDFNGDDKLDVATANSGSSPDLSVLLGDDNSFDTAINLTFEGESPRSVVAGDFNGDGNDDLAAQDVTRDSISVFLSTGAGGFQPAISYDAGATTHCLATNDFNGDGHNDLAVGRLTGGVSILLGTGTGSFGPPVNFATYGEPYFVTSGDINGDQKVDIISGTNGNFFSIILGMGTGSFGEPIPFFMPEGWGVRWIAVNDFNRDGINDLATANSADSNSVSIFLSTCINSDTIPPVLTVPSTITVNATSPAGAIVAYSVSATDNLDPNPVVSCTPSSGSALPIGSTLVNCTATDASGNSASAGFTVIVAQDTPLPTCTPSPDPVPLPPPPIPSGGIRRALVMAQSHKIGGYGHLLYQPGPDVIQHNPEAKPNLDIVVDTGSKWVRLWADWPFYQPSDRFESPTNPFPNIVDLEDSCSAHYIERDPRTSALIQSLDDQVILARSKGLRIILTSSHFPVWATYPKSLFSAHQESVVPDNVGVDSPWGKWIKFLVKRYGYSEATRNIRGYGRFVEFLELTNEPNLDMRPQRGMPEKVAQMFKTAQTIVRAQGNMVRLAGPGTSDIDHSGCQQDRHVRTEGTNYAEFTEELLKHLRRIGFVADENFAWSHHNYRDVECDKDGVVRRELRKTDFPTVNSAAWVRWMIVTGDSRYKWEGWPNRLNPQILITEGGARLNALPAKYPSLLDNNPAMQIRKQQQKQRYLFKENFLRMAGKRDRRLAEGIAMVSSYLAYTDPAFDSGLLDFVGLCKIPVLTWDCGHLPLGTVPIWECRLCEHLPPGTVPNRECRPDAVCTGEWGKKRLVYAKWKSLPSSP